MVPLLRVFSLLAVLVLIGAGCSKEEGVAPGEQEREAAPDLSPAVPRPPRITFPDKVHLTYTPTPDEDELLIKGKTNLEDGTEVKVTLWGGKPFQCTIRSTELVDVKDGAFEAHLFAPWPFRYRIYAIVILHGDSRDQARKRMTSGLRIERDGDEYSLLNRQVYARKDKHSRSRFKTAVQEFRDVFAVVQKRYKGLEELDARIHAGQGDCHPCELRDFRVAYRREGRDHKISMSKLCSFRPFLDQCEWLITAWDGVDKFLDDMNPDRGLDATGQAYLKERKELLGKIEAFLRLMKAKGY